MNILIVQRHVPHYRIPIFDKLACQCSGQVTVLHSGSPLPDDKEVAYNEIVVPSFNLLGIHYQKDLSTLASQHDVAVLLFDVRWVSNIALVTRGFFTQTSCRTVWWGHGFGRSRKAQLVRPLRVLLARMADASLVYDQLSRDEMIKWGCRSERIFVAPNTLRVSNCGFDSEIERNQFLFVGRLQRRKRVEDLLYAFARASLPAHVGITVVGSGAYEKYLRQIARQQGIISRVRFCGRVVDAKQLKPIFQKSLAYVSPGAVGLGVLHSFAYGVPVITQHGAMHGPEVENMEDNHNSCFYDGTIEALAEKLRLLVENQEESRRLGRNAYRHYVQKRTPENMVRGFEAAIACALSS